MAKGGFPGMGGGSMNNLIKQAQKFQKQMEDMQKELENKTFEGTAGGGAVTATVSGKREILKVSIEPDVVDPDDVEMLEDLVMLACNEALKKAEEETNSSMGKLTGGLNMPGMF
ncbi:DNA-binding protein, YbaB/EbfC family [Clostridium argentinense CDC 2741]|uniref:Nucleoid-associated protein U732_4195 n=1 Tax=Clostridium argentinense CDC 2741 TaxID=1418104 RepID=A0A0C1RDD2_9CLOT|nr:YbaB/EbfC family nucleoid-associated protein [Clostridium argentinense]HAG43484.1 nucleoid-associated protein, YbaB/EbfC family [Clostridium sp.]ARC83286.1 nucleoid-associated protein, YbaB/EbfC family [Clostridium argentinense]KIE48391.1 DNA-binding protein, YbaB/EbfC family [Clostridium argentinense CDC 2741]NFF41453.1 YbaB/EbfC family nucleoid-associated protein [Clostridium argentinense]NFP52115.1 YbaB/EbfC family nucleoid-associated protein [Clostridium argentinense]